MNSTAGIHTGHIRMSTVLTRLDVVIEMVNL